MSHLTGDSLATRPGGSGPGLTAGTVVEDACEGVVVEASGRQWLEHDWRCDGWIVLATYSVAVGTYTGEALQSSRGGRVTIL